MHCGTTVMMNIRTIWFMAFRCYKWSYKYFDQFKIMNACNWTTNRWINDFVLPVMTTHKHSSYSDKSVPRTIRRTYRETQIQGGRTGGHEIRRDQLYGGRGDIHSCRWLSDWCQVFQITLSPFWLQKSITEGFLKSWSQPIIMMKSVIFQLCHYYNVSHTVRQFSTFQNVITHS